MACPTCSNCQSDLEVYLSNIPSAWRTQLINVICNQIKQAPLSCTDVRDCLADGSILTCSDVIACMEGQLPSWTGHSNSLVITPGGPNGYNPAIEFVPSTDAGNTVTLGTDGKPFVPASNKPPLNTTYSQLVASITANTLIPGTEYIITDYQTVYDQDQTGTLLMGPVEPLMVVAVTHNKLSPIASSLTYPNDIIYYNINNDGRVIGSLLGYIYRRNFTVQNIDLPLDWRVILYRRWAINVTAAYSPATTYARYSIIVASDTNLYISKIDSNIANNPLTDTVNWFKLPWVNGSQISPTETTYSFSFESNLAVSIPVNNTSFTDYNIFGTGITSGTFNILIKETLDVDIIAANNSVFLGSNISENNIGNKFIGNTIEDAFQNNVIGDSFRGNLINSTFTFNNIDKLFQGNIVDVNFKNNITDHSVYGCFFGSAAEANYIKSYAIGILTGVNFIENKFGIACHKLSFGDNAQLNTIGDYGESSTFGLDFQNNVIGTNSLNNVFGDTCQSNSIGNYPSTLIIGNNFQNNKTGHYFNTNTIETDCKGNTWGLSFANSTVGTFFQNNKFTDFCNLLTIGNSVFANTWEYPITGITITDATVTNTYTNKQLYYLNTLPASFNSYTPLGLDNFSKQLRSIPFVGSYVWKLTQSGTADPTTLNLANNVDGTFASFTRLSAGVYKIVLVSPVFDASKRWGFFIQPLVGDNLHYAYAQATGGGDFNSFKIFTQDFATNTPTDGILNDTVIELKTFH